MCDVIFFINYVILQHNKNICEIQMQFPAIVRTTSNQVWLFTVICNSNIINILQQIDKVVINVIVSHRTPNICCTGEWMEPAWACTVVQQHIMDKMRGTLAA